MNSLQRLLKERPIVLQILRFVAIGVLNTALDFTILNFATKALGITSGLSLGAMNVISFSAAMVQSYFWNHYWAFSASQTVDAVKNFVRLVVVGGIGAITFIAVLAGARAGATPAYFILVFAFFISTELCAWYGFGLHRQDSVQPSGSEFLAFVIVSAIGLLINSVLVAVISQALVNNPNFSNPDLVKNAAKIVATMVSLVWNFVGYKLIVFKK
jgi:putative flippase GtrA